MRPLFVRVAGAGLLAAALFVWVFGTDVLDVHKSGWMVHGDSAQHYLGWAFFRSADWQWPLGLVANFGYPFKTTLAFTDSIPLWALPLKLLSPWLPDEFNYFGWWMAACLVGNAVAAACVLSRAGLSAVAVVAGAGLFALTPCMMLRAYGHESLMAQGLLVVALGLAWLPREPQPFRGAYWVALLVVCVLVHPYFWVMVCALFAATLWQAHGLRRLPVASAAAWLLTGLLLSGAVLFSLGYFDGSGKSISAIGYPNYSANLLTWLDPMDWHWFLQQYQRDPAGSAQWSRVLPALGQADRDQYEGFAYLGAGMLLLVGVALWSAWLRPEQKADATAGQTGRESRHVWGWPVWTVLGLMATYALSTKVTWGQWVLLDLHRSDAVHQWLSVFRACGRFVWPLTYALMLWSLVQLARFSVRVQWGWVVLALGVQVVDLSGKMGEFHAMYSPARSYTTPLTDPGWDSALQGATHLVVLEDTSKSEDWVAFSFLAARHGVVNSTGLLSRVDERQQLAWLAAQKSAVFSGQPVARHVYVSHDEFPDIKGWTRHHMNGWWLLVADAGADGGVTSAVQAR